MFFVIVRYESHHPFSSHRHLLEKESCLSNKKIKKTMAPLKQKISTKDNPDGTVTTTTITYKVDGTKHTKRKTSGTKTVAPQNASGDKAFAPRLPVDNRGGCTRFPVDNRGGSRFAADDRGGNPQAESNSVKDARSRTVSPMPRTSSIKLPKRSASAKMKRASSTKTMKRSASTKDLVTEMVSEVKQELKRVLGVGHSDDSIFASKISRAIPAEIVLIASQDDVTQAQEGDAAKTRFNLPDIEGTNGESGSLATSALLQLLFENPKRVLAGTKGDKSAATPHNCREFLKEIQKRVKTYNESQEANPVISSSRPLGPPAMKDGQFAPFYLVPPGFTGKRRALLISVVTGEGDALNGPPNDIQYVKHFLTKHGGFLEKDITVLRDDANAGSDCQRSTKQNIMDGFAQIVQQSKSKDVVVIQFSGHGGRMGDNLYLLPCDYKEQGQIMDDDILKDVIKYMPAKVHCTMLIDCCYSGVVGEMPYTLHSKEGDPEEQEIEEYFDTDTRDEMIEQEATGGAEYKEKKKARSKWRNVSRIASAAKGYAEEFAKAAGQAQKATGKAAKQALDTGSSHLRSSVKTASNVLNTSMHSASSDSGVEKKKQKKIDADIPAPKVEKPAKAALRAIPRNSRAKAEIEAAREQAKRGIPARSKSTTGTTKTGDMTAGAVISDGPAAKRKPPRRSKSMTVEATRTAGT